VLHACGARGAGHDLIVDRPVRSATEVEHAVDTGERQRSRVVVARLASDAGRNAGPIGLARHRPYPGPARREHLDEWSADGARGPR